VTEMAGGGLAAHSLKPEGLADDCARTALVVTARPAPPSCPAAVVDRDRSRSQGAIALWRGAFGFTIAANRPRGVDRPWSPAPADDSGTEAGLTPRSKSPRAIDATPAEADWQPDE